MFARVLGQLGAPPRYRLPSRTWKSALGIQCRSPSQEDPEFEEAMTDWKNFPLIPLPLIQSKGAVTYFSSKRLLKEICAFVLSQEEQSQKKYHTP